VFDESQSQTYDSANGAPILGGTSGEAVLVSGPDPVSLSRLRELFRLATRR
jgi:hypothetical protein